MSVIDELKKILKEKVKYREDELINIVIEIYYNKKSDVNTTQKDLYIKMRIKELKKTEEKYKFVNEEDFQEEALKDYYKKSI
tara:strand:+ start:4277 stop:4522 length:246 start_codon:yes stop_codon:yes gene_type:complete